MKKICFLGYDLTKCGGLGRVMTSLANALCEDESDYEIHMVTVCNSQGNDFFFPVHERVKKHIIGVNSGFRFRKIMFAAFRDLKKYIKNNNIDVLYLGDFTIPPIAMMVRFFVKCKMIFADHGTLSNQLDHKKATIFRKIGCKISEKIVVLTKKNLEAYKNIFGVKKEKLEIIYNWIDEEVLKFVKPYNFNSKIIMSSGRFTAEKGFNMLPDIAEIIFKKHPDWQWHIFGDGPEMEKIKLEILAKKLEKNVIFKGFTETMYDKYRDAGIFVLTSYREGLSLVLMEAKAHALPLVSFDCVAGPSEIITENVDGFLILCYNKEEMASKICKLIEEPGLRLVFSENSKANLEKFNKDLILEKWKKLLNKL